MRRHAGHALRDVATAFAQTLNMAHNSKKYTCRLLVQLGSKRKGPKDKDHRGRVRIGAWRPPLSSVHARSFFCLQMLCTVLRRSPSIQPTTGIDRNVLHALL